MQILIMDLSLSGTLWLWKSHLLSLPSKHVLTPCCEQLTCAMPTGMTNPALVRPTLVAGRGHW